MVLIDLQFFRREVSWGLGWLSASYTWVGSIHYSGIPVMGITAAKKKAQRLSPFYCFLYHSLSWLWGS